MLAMQGAFQEHEAALERALGALGRDAEIVQARRPEHLEAADGLVLPGGESTTIDKLLRSSGSRGPLVEEVEAGTPVLATCAGAILLSSEGDEEVERTDTRLLGLLDVAIERNAFGRQRESFEAPVHAPVLGEDPFPGVFIRAPAIAQVWGRAEPVARLEDEIVGVEQGNVLALTFHPELSRDTRVHERFLERVYG